MAADDADALFDAAQEALKKCTEISNEDKLRVYAHFKQATVGPASGTRPGMFDPVARAKWDAWAKLRDMSMDEAKRLYIGLADNMAAGWRPPTGNGQTAASVSSTVAAASDEVSPAAHSSAASEAESVPPSRARKQVFGFRTWLMRSMHGEGLDSDSSPHGHDDGLDASRSLVVARSIADKFLVRCLLDEELRPFYSHAAVRLMELKGHLSEAFAVALRAGCAPPATPSLEAYRGLTQAHLDLLRGHIREACAEFRSTSEAEEARLVVAVPHVRGLPLALLPRQQAGETESEDRALQRHGADEPASKLGGIEWAPLTVPMKRRRQMLGCVVSCSLLPAGVFLALICLFYWRTLWPLIVPYYTYALVIDKTPWKGGMKTSSWLRRNWFFRRWAEYFPASLIKADPEADFSGKRPVLMGYHPHGILSFGAQVNFGSDCTGWAEKFPKLQPRLATLNMNLKMPFLREIIGRLGAIPADASSIRAALRPGNAVIVVVGGAAEALDTKPGEYVLTLARRSGFFRLALQHGVDLVPTFGFGENDIFETIKCESFFRTIQLKAYKVMSFSMPIFHGRSVFTYNFGLLPYRKPLTVVVGTPIRVEKVEAPTKEQIEAVKQEYIAALRRLHAEWQPRLEPKNHAPLIVI